MLLMLSVILAAQPLEEAQVPPRLVEAVADWTFCRHAYIGRRLGDDVDDAALAERAFAACVEHERRVDAGMREMGEDWAAQVAPQRARFLARAVRFIRERRSGQAPSEPGHGWGLCVSHNLVPVSARLTAEAIIDRAISACRHFEPGMLRQLEQEHGSEAATILRSFHSEFRAQAIRQLDAGSIPTRR